MINPPILYTAAGCTDSRKVRNWLIERGVAFVERNVTGDIDAARELLATGAFGTPLLVVGGKRVIGYQADKLAAEFSGSG